MTRLCQRMIDELRRRNYAERTIKSYVAGVAAFACFHQRSPELLGLDDVRRFQLHLRDVKQLSFSSYPVTCALSLFCRRRACAPVGRGSRVVLAERRPGRTARRP